MNAIAAGPVPIEIPVLLGVLQDAADALARLADLVADLEGRHTALEARVEVLSEALIEREIHDND